MLSEEEVLAGILDVTGVAVGGVQSPAAETAAAN
jgi:hypothetical protein